MNNQKNIQSRHFQLEQVGEGAYAAIANPEGWAVSNAGIIDLGDRTLVFDTFLTPIAAHDLRIAAERLTGREVSLVINSHYHNDHIWGNQDFANQADIISTAETRRLISTAGMEEYAWYTENSEGRLKTLKKEYNTVKEPGRRQQLSHSLAFFQGLVESIPTLEVDLPNLTFVDRMDFHGENRTALAIPFSGGHTASDAVLYLPEQGVLYMSDLLFVRFHPYLPDGNPSEWERILVEIEREYPAEVYVPGHGPLGTRQDLKILRQYIADLRSLAQRVLKKGQPEEALEAIPIPAPYADWEMPNFFMENLRFLYQKFSRV